MQSLLPDFIGSLAERVFHHSAQFGFLDVSDCNINGQVGLAIILGVRSLPKL